jgi:hypothetical protein
LGRALSSLHDNEVGLGNGVSNGFGGLILRAVVTPLGRCKVCELDHNIALTANALLGLERTAANDKSGAEFFECGSCRCQILGIASGIAHRDTYDPIAFTLLADEIDAALVAEPVSATQFDSIPVFREQPVIVAAKGCPKIGPGQVPKSVIVFEHGCPHRKRLEAWYDTAGELPERVIEIGSYHAMLGCVLAGMGAALLPRSVLETFPESKRLQVFSLPRGQGQIATLFIWRKGVRSSKVEALAQVLSATGAKG